MSAQESCSQAPGAHLASVPSDPAKTHLADRRGVWDPQGPLLKETGSLDSQLL